MWSIEKGFQDGTKNCESLAGKGEITDSVPIEGYTCTAGYEKAYNYISNKGNMLVCCVRKG